MAKKVGILLLVLLCLMGCGGQISEPAVKESQVMYYHDGSVLWGIFRDGRTEKISAEPCSICADGVVYEIFGQSEFTTVDADGQEGVWGLRVNGEVVCQEPYEMGNPDDSYPRFMPVLHRDTIQVVGEYVYFIAYVDNRACSRLCRIGKDGADLTVFEGFSPAEVKLLSDGNTVYFLSGEDYYPAKLDLASEEMVVLEEATVSGQIFYELASGRVWWKSPDYETGTSQLHSARALGGERVDYDQFTGLDVYRISGSSVYYRQENNLCAWDFTSMEEKNYPVSFLKEGGLVEACQWGGLLIDETRNYWMLDFETGSLTKLILA